MNQSSICESHDVSSCLIVNVKAFSMGSCHFIDDLTSKQQVSFTDYDLDSGEIGGNVTRDSNISDKRSLELSQYR